MLTRFLQATLCYYYYYSSKKQRCREFLVTMCTHTQTIMIREKTTTSAISWCSDDAQASKRQNGIDTVPVCVYICLHGSLSLLSHSTSFLVLCPFFYTASLVFYLINQLFLHVCHIKQNKSIQ
jgi:hypothetical protein